MSAGGVQLGPYELVERLGAGGMAETFVALKRGPGAFEQRVCIKRILPIYEQDEMFIAAFMEEARLSARLRHANVVQVLDFGVSGTTHYLALELIEGVDLSRLLKSLAERGERLTSGIVAYIAVELAHALEHAHTHTSGAVLHRDVSPSNVLLSLAGEVKLSDFGIAKAANVHTEPGSPQTRTGTLKGKTPYMAAEYALSGKFEVRSDLFAFGVLLYECLAGRRPFVGHTELDTLHRIATGNHPPLRELCPGAPDDLVDAIERLLRPEPGDRFPTAAAFVDALVDSAPPATARRILAELVRSARSGMRPSRVTEAPVKTAPLPHREPARSGSAQDETARGRRHDPAGEEGGVPRGDPSVPTRTTPRPIPSGALEQRPAERANESSPTPLPVSDLIQPRRAPLPILLAGGALVALVSVGALGVWVSAWSRDVPLEPRGSPRDPTDEHTANPPPTSPAARPPAPDTAGGPPATLVADTDEAPPSAADTAEGPPVGTLVADIVETPPVEAPSSSGEPSGESPRSGSEDPGARSRRTEGSARPGRDRARGELRVTVQPWGNVWIDDRFMGRAPVTATLEAGTHQVAVGFDRPVVRRTIRLEPGGVQRIELAVVGE